MPKIVFCSYSASLHCRIHDMLTFWLIKLKNLSRIMCDAWHRVHGCILLSSQASQLHQRCLVFGKRGHVLRLCPNYFLLLGNNRKTISSKVKNHTIFYWKLITLFFRETIFTEKVIVKIGSGGVIFYWLCTVCMTLLHNTALLKALWNLNKNPMTLVVSRALFKRSDYWKHTN